MLGQTAVRDLQQLAAHIHKMHGSSGHLSECTIVWDVLTKAKQLRQQQEASRLMRASQIDQVPFGPVVTRPARTHKVSGSNLVSGAKQLSRRSLDGAPLHSEDYRCCVSELQNAMAT